MIARRIVDVAAIDGTDLVVEIGAGLGALTSLLAARAQRVLAIERDRDLAAILRQTAATLPNVEIIEANALTFDFSALPTRAVVVGNLPYHISSPLLFHLLDHRLQVRSATVMLQQELAQRLAAPPGTRLYGAPSVMLQQYADVSTCFHVKSGAFLPAPRVDSTVLQMIFRTSPRFAVDPQVLRQVVRASFAGRRKTLLRALSSIYPRVQVEQALRTANVDPKARAETLGVEQFAALGNALAETTLADPSEAP